MEGKQICCQNPPVPRALFTMAGGFVLPILWGGGLCTVESFLMWCTVWLLYTWVSSLGATNKKADLWIRIRILPSASKKK
jgi:hypothetical protein